MTEISQATKAFVQREFGTLGDPGMLTVVPDLPLPEAGMTQEDMARNIFSSLAMQGGLVDSDARTQTIMADPNTHPDVKKMLKEMQKKYSGDKGEYEVLVPLLAEMLAKEGAIIFGHKTHNSLIEETVRQKLIKDGVPEEDLQMKLLDCMFNFIGVQCDRSRIQREAEKEVLAYFGSLGTKLVTEVEATIARQRARTDGTKQERLRRGKDMTTLQAAVDHNNKSPLPKTHLDPLDIKVQAKMGTELSTYKREHDIILLRPEYKALLQVEVKAMKDNVGRINQIMESALKQLQGGKEEARRLHGHLLDAYWSFIGIIALPNLTSQQRDDICQAKQICQYCKQFILVDIIPEMNQVFSSLFTTKFTDELVWRPQYKELLARLVSQVHMVPSLKPMEKITGTTEQVIGAFTHRDEVNLDLLNCSVADFIKWKEADHRGSPISIFFLNRQQLLLWGELLVVFIADYSVGKTTLAKSKAVSLALKGETVGFFFLHQAKDPNNDILDPVMAVVNEAQLSNISTHSHLSLQQFYTNTEKANNKWWQKLHKTISRPAPLSGLQLVRYYIQNSPQAPDHIFLDEASLELSANAVTRSASPSTVDIPCTVKVLGELAALLPASSHLWVALHTQHVRDTTGFSVTDAELNQLETSLRSKNFHLPSLRHNMRNTEGVAKVGQE